MPTIKKYKIARRLGPGVFEKTQTPKFAASEARRSRFAKKAGPKRPTDFGISLIEKQRVRFTYNVSEKQFSNYVKKSFEVAKKGIAPADFLFQALERRLDNVVYRLGIAPTRTFARQVVSHGHILVNGKKVSVPSYATEKGDVISIREGSKTNGVFSTISERLKDYKVPEWVSFDDQSVSWTVKGTPKNPDQFMNFQAVIEFYSR